MTDPAVDIAFYLQPRFFDASDDPKVLVIRLAVGQDITWDMLPYPTTARSCVTQEAYEDYASRLEVARPLSRSLVIDDLLIEGQSVQPLRIVPSLAPSRLGVDGFLGLDFFSRFDVVEWHPKTRFVRLRSG